MERITSEDVSSIRRMISPRRIPKELSSALESILNPRQKSIVSLMDRQRIGDPSFQYCVAGSLIENALSERSVGRYPFVCYLRCQGRHWPSFRPHVEILDVTMGMWDVLLTCDHEIRIVLVESFDRRKCIVLPPDRGVDHYVDFVHYCFDHPHFRNRNCTSILCRDHAFLRLDTLASLSYRKTTECLENSPTCSKGNSSASPISRKTKKQSVRRFFADL